MVVSFGKSGRTWLRVLLSRFYQLEHDLPEHNLIGFDNLHRKNAAIPRIFFTHDNYLKDYTGNVDSKKDYYGKKVILLARNPLDTTVSQYFQWKFRMRPGKKALNDYPEHGSDLDIFPFMMDRDAGLPKVIDYLNLWAREAPKCADFLLVRYEDMRADTAGTLERIVKFIGTPGTRGADPRRGGIRLGREHARDGNQAHVLEERQPHGRQGRQQPRLLQGAQGQGRRLSRLLRRCAGARDAGAGQEGARRLLRFSARGTEGRLSRGLRPRGPAANVAGARSHRLRPT